MFIDPVEEIHSHTTWKHIYPAYDLHTKKYFSKKKKKNRKLSEVRVHSYAIYLSAYPAGL